MHNPLLEYLTAIGLPWQSSRASLADQYGIRPHAAYTWDVIEIETPRPIVNGLLWPLSVQVFSQFSPHMPATEFSGVTYLDKDARKNMQLTVGQLIPVLGKGERTGSSNTIGHKWAFGPASIELIVWPPDMQRGPIINPAHAREPRLKTGCHVYIKTGFRPRATAQEKALLDSFIPVAQVFKAQPTPRPTRDLPVPQHELEFIRLPEENCGPQCGWLGYSADRSALIFFGHELYLIPMEDVLQFQVARILPAKGGGGSWLEVTCRCNYTSQKTKTVTLCSGDRADELNDLAATVANAMGKPLVLMPYEYDA